MGDLHRALVARSTALAQDLATDFAEGNRLYTVVITRAGSEPKFDRASGEWTVDTPAAQVYAGPARIQPVSTSETEVGGDEPAYYGLARVSINHDVTLAPRIDDVITVADTPYSLRTKLANRQFRITSVEVGGQIDIGFSFVASGIAPSRFNP